MWLFPAVDFCKEQEPRALDGTVEVSLRGTSVPQSNRFLVTLNLQSKAFARDREGFYNILLRIERMIVDANNDVAFNNNLCAGSAGGNHLSSTSIPRLRRSG